MHKSIDPILIGNLAGQITNFFESTTGKWTLSELDRKKTNLVVTVHVDRTLDTIYIFMVTGHGLCKLVRDGERALTSTLLEPAEFLKQIIAHDASRDLGAIVRACVEDVQAVALGKGLKIDSPTTPGSVH